MKKITVKNLLIIVAVFMIQGCFSFYAQPLDYECMVVGNDYSGKYVWVPHNVYDIFVTPDGTTYTNVPWDEAGGNVCEINPEGKITRKIWVGNHGGGKAVTANAEYIFIAGDRYRTGEQGIDRRDRNNPDTSTNVHVTCGDAFGLACSGDRLYASIKEADVIKVFDVDLNPIPGENIPVDDPEDLYVDHEGMLWVLQTSSGKVLRMDPSTGNQTGEIALSPDIKPTDIAIHDNKLYVTDESANERVWIYGNIDESPVFEKYFGKQGGIFSGRKGEYAPLKLIQPRGIGVDEKGHIRIANRPGNNGGAIFQKYTPSGAMEWDLGCTVWIDKIDPSPQDENIVYASDAKIRLDYGKETWTYESHTVDRHRYPDDGRVGGHGGSTFVRELSGRNYLYIIRMNGTDIKMFRFEGEIAIPTGYIKVKENAFWYDANGNGQEEAREISTHKTGLTRGWWIDINGTIWQATEKEGIYTYPVEGIDDHGSARYTPSSLTHYSMPGPFNKLRRIRYYPEQNNQMVINGFTAEWPDSTHHWKRAGKVFAGYENWNGEFGSWDWHIVPEYEERNLWGGGGNVQSFDVLNEYIFFGRCGKSENLGNSSGHVDVWRYADSTNLGYMEPCPKLGNRNGWLDMTESLEAYQLSSGMYIIAIEEDYRSKNILYKWRP